MSLETWQLVDHYISGMMVNSDEALEAALRESQQAELPPINVTPPLGKFLHLLARMHGAKRILEIGTLGGYSTIWLGRALPPGGRLISLEANSKCAAVARSNIERAGLSSVVEVRLGPALESLRHVAESFGGPIDFFFIDANKENNPEYFQWALKLSRPGSVIIVDNVIRNGAVLDAASSDPDVQGTRRLNDLVSRETRVTATELQTVGGKGYDGFLLAIVNS